MHETLEKPMPADYRGAGRGLELPVRQNVENRALFGEAYGVVEGRQRDCGTEFDRLGARSDRSQRDQRGGRITILGAVMFGHPGPFKPNAFGPRNELQRLSVQFSPWSMPLLRVSEIVQIPERQLVLHDHLQRW